MNAFLADKSIRDSPPPSIATIFESLALWIVADKSIRDTPRRGALLAPPGERRLFVTSGSKALPQATRRANNRSEYDYSILSTRNLSLG